MSWVHQCVGANCLTYTVSHLHHLQGKYHHHHYTDGKNGGSERLWNWPRSPAVKPSTRPRFKEDHIQVPQWPVSRLQCMTASAYGSPQASPLPFASPDASLPVLLHVRSSYYWSPLGTQARSMPSAPECAPCQMPASSVSKAHPITAKTSGSGTSQTVSLDGSPGGY